MNEHMQERNEGTKLRKNEGTKERRNEGTRERGNEGTRERGNEGTKGRILEPALSSKESYLKLHIISGVSSFSIPVELHHGSPVPFTHLCEEEALFRVFGWF